MKWRAYRLIMRTAHRFSWHYAPTFGPIEPDGTFQQWCQWCGLRMNLPPGRTNHEDEDAREENKDE